MTEPDRPSGNRSSSVPNSSSAARGHSRSGAREPRIYLFESGTHVLWAEEVARERQMAVEVVPAPSGFSNHCGLAIRVFADVAPTLEALLEEEGISFRPLH